MKKDLSIYIHIPFCVSKCHYCDFTSFSGCDERIIEKYFKALTNEIIMNSELISQSNIKTIYIGGGTPSFVDAKYIEMILNTIYMLTDKSTIEEITIEVNPCSLTLEKAKKYHDIGINRISIGLQTIYNDILKIIGRKHTYEDFLNTLNILNNVGFNNLSCDIIYPLPNLSLKNFKSEIDEIINLSKKYPLKHISVYNLEVHKGTKLEFLLNEGYVKLCDEDEEYEMRKYLNNKLEDACFKNYEISNYALPSYESKHNTNYWNQNEYLGLGLSASSFINGSRYKNVDKIDEYILETESGNITKIDREDLDFLDLIKEYIILRLRLKEGIVLKDFERKFNTSIYEYFENEIEELKNNNLINVTDSNIMLTSRGREVANLVWEKFI